jgi:myo-inositol-1(or 4)-monophosphatase
MHPMLNIGLRIAKNTLGKFHYLQESGRLLDMSNAECAAECKELQYDIAGEIKKSYPDHYVAKDSCDENIMLSERSWLVLPIAGIENLARDYFKVAVSFLYFENGRIEAAIVIDPSCDDIYSAHRGGTARVGQRRLRVAESMSLEETIWGLSTASSRSLENDVLQALYQNTGSIRSVGVPLLDCLQVAAGWTDGYIGVGAHYWDLAPGLFIIGEAGGLSSDFSGGECHKGILNAVVTNRKLMRQMIKIVSTA